MRGDLDLTAQLPERFEVLGVRAQGAMGVVFRARDRELKRLVAIKVMRPGVGLGRDLQRFRREFGLLAALEHPRVVRLFDCGVEGVHAYYVMELLDGTGLEDPAARPRGPDAVATRLVEILEPLAYIHARGVLHRDLKPSNVFLDRLRGPVLIDFGLSRTRDAAERLTHEGAAVGTVQYMAPEVLQGGEGSERSDLFAVAVMGYEWLVGEPLHGEDGPLGLHLPTLLSSLVSGSFHDHAAARLAGHGALGRVLLRGLAPDAADRYATGEELAEALAGPRSAAARTAPPSGPAPSGEGGRPAPTSEPRAAPPGPAGGGRWGPWVAGAALGMVTLVPVGRPLAPAPAPESTPLPSSPPSRPDPSPRPAPPLGAGELPPEGAWMQERSLAEFPGLGAPAQGADKLANFLGSGGRFTEKLILRVTVEPVGPATRAWVVLDVPELRPGQRVRLDLDQRRQLDLAAPPGRAGTLSHALPAAALAPGEHMLRLTLLTPPGEVPHPVRVERLRLFRAP